MKTQTRIAIIIIAASVAIVSLFGGAVYYFQNKYSYLDFYKRLETRAGIAARYNLEPDLNAETLLQLRNQHLERLDQEREFILEVQPGTDIAELAAHNNLPETFLINLQQQGQARARDGNTFFAGITHAKAGKLYMVIVSAGNYYASHHLISLRNLLIVSVVLLLLIVVALSMYFSKQIFVPIREITDRVKQISTESIHLRLDSNNKNNNEIASLANTFNDLLNRLETAFETQKNFISNASHELGTPLTAIIGEADVALLKDRSVSEYRDTLNNILKQAERLDQITRTLLFLAQTGYKGNTIVFERMRIDEVIWETKSLIDKLNPGNNIVAELGLLPEDPKKLKIKGNRQLLQLAFSNLLSNACKYSNNNPVSVYIASSNTHVIVTIKDLGIGIPEKELDYIYDPFFRASNTGLFEGYGIGLPLARNIIVLHEGSIAVSSAVNEGTTVQVRLPVY
jgi:signal transduction histidine kinase